MNLAPSSPYYFSFKCVFSRPKKTQTNNPYSKKYPKVNRNNICGLNLLNKPMLGFKQVKFYLMVYTVVIMTPAHFAMKKKTPHCYPSSTLRGKKKENQVYFSA